MATKDYKDTDLVEAGALREILKSLPSGGGSESGSSITVPTTSGLLLDKNNRLWLTPPTASATEISYVGGVLKFNVRAYTNNQTDAFITLQVIDSSGGIAAVDQINMTKVEETFSKSINVENAVTLRLIVGTTATSIMSQSAYPIPQEADSSSNGSVSSSTDNTYISGIARTGRGYDVFVRKDTEDSSPDMSRLSVQLWTGDENGVSRDTTISVTEDFSDAHQKTYSIVCPEANNPIAIALVEDETTVIEVMPLLQDNKSFLAGSIKRVTRSSAGALSADISVIAPIGSQIQLTANLEGNSALNARSITTTEKVTDTAVTFPTTISSAVEKMQLLVVLPPLSNGVYVVLDSFYPSVPDGSSIVFDNRNKLSVVYPSFEINNEGHLIVTYPDDANIYSPNHQGGGSTN